MNNNVCARRCGLERLRRFVRDTPAVEAAWDVIKESKDHNVIRHFVDQFPSKKRRVVADTRLAALNSCRLTATPKSAESGHKLS
jgi:hypothetical protein